ncbi:ABC transporter substrate-binding protein [Komagataeibacter rhaeticus]|nr:ABC transporter substrate-binding protein [Komagataeibacter rhaeticus]
MGQPCRQDQFDTLIIPTRLYRKRACHGRARGPAVSARGGGENLRSFWTGCSTSITRRCSPRRNAGHSRGQGWMWNWSPLRPGFPARLVTAGQADVALGYGTQINLLVDQGLPLVRFGTLIDRPINVVAAMGNGSVRTLADLKGRRVGLSVSGVEESLLAAMLHSAGLSISDVTVTKVNYQMVTALLTGRIDAAIGAYRNAEVLEIEHTSGIAPVIFAPEDHGVPLYDELIMLTRQDLRGTHAFHASLPPLRKGARHCLPIPMTCGAPLSPDIPSRTRPCLKSLGHDQRVDTREPGAPGYGAL